MASNEKLPTYEEALEDEWPKSYNELIKLGFTEKQLQIRGIDLSDIDKDKKIFYIILPEELEHLLPNDLKDSSLNVEKDFKNAYARFLTDKKFIYKITGVETLLAIEYFVSYIKKYADVWLELEIWQVVEDDYVIDPSTIKVSTVKLQNLTIEMLEKFFEATTPRKLIITRK